MAMEVGEIFSKTCKNKGTQISGDASYSETEFLKYAENGEREGEETRSGNQSSPRGVLDGRSSGSGSDSDKAVAGDLMSYGNLHWKKMVGQAKKTSMWSFSTMSVMMGQELTKSKKTWKKKKMDRRRGTSEGDFSLDDGEFVVPNPSWRNFSYEELMQATNNFSPGGHADVYKGFLPDGEVVAVKKITKKNKKDEDKVGDFLAELGILAHIDHPNTAKLIGFSADQGLHLVLQFSPHGSLATVLHGSGDRSGRGNELSAF